MSDTRTEIVEALDRLNSLVGRRDHAILDEFDDRADVLLVGSEVGEIAEGPEALAAFFRHIFELPVRIGWSWQNVRVSSADNVAWLFAEGHVVITSESGQKKMPYRLTGVLERRAEKWKWRHFHGSEPVQKRNERAA
jgi:ketosteroid isomerase-like protein